ncbi:MAG: hypothetical protein Q7K55_06045 [Candidatus Levybacteria bacterium]|nr:hypothetical protein [Candidatus Levybacteria bacterium]
MVKIPSLKELKSIIKEEASNVGIKDYSRNIINTSLILIADTYGEEEANNTINEFSLDENEDWIDFFDKPEIKEIRKMYKNKPEFHVQVLKDFRKMNH